MRDLILINERGGPAYWDSVLPSKETTYAIISKGRELFLDRGQFQEALRELKGKKVLVLIHGLNNPKEAVLYNWGVAHKNLSLLNSTRDDSYLTKMQRFISSYLGFWKPETKEPYDAVIGISWPSYAKEMYYYHAKQNAKLIAPKVAGHIEEITKAANEVDILAHSLGNFLLFEALSKQQERSPKINHIFSIAAAVPAASLNVGRPYENVSKICKKIFVFYSKHDEALYWPFFLEEGGQNALGLTGANHNQPLSSNVTSLNCSQIVQHHSAYLFKKPLYRFIERNHNQEYHPKIRKHVHLILDELANALPVNS